MTYILEKQIGRILTSTTSDELNTILPKVVQHLNDMEGLVIDTSTFSKLVT